MMHDHVCHSAATQCEMNNTNVLCNLGNFDIPSQPHYIPYSGILKLNLTHLGKISCMTYTKMIRSNKK